MFSSRAMAGVVVSSRPNGSVAEIAGCMLSIAANGRAVT
jgi:hypothetical protein